MNNLKKQLIFLCKADQLKNILRKTSPLYRFRKENSAEHSWHATLAAMILLEHSNTRIDLLNVLQMLLVHDLVEIYAGDTFLYDKEKTVSKFANEIEAAERIFKTLPKKQADDLKKTWLEFEAGKSDDALFARSVDRMLPLLHNYLNKGGSWSEYQISMQEAIVKNQQIEKGSQDLWCAAKEIIQKAENKGLFAKPNGVESETIEASEYELLDVVLDVPLKTTEGWDLKMGAFTTKRKDGEIEEHALIYKNNIRNPDQPILLRINSACYTGDIFHCLRCDCTWQLLQSMQMIDSQGGMIIYHFNHEGRGIGFLNKLKTLLVMDREHKTTKEAFEHIGKAPDVRDFYPSILILQELGISRIKLITNSPDKRDVLVNNGIIVEELIPLVTKKPSLRKYLFSKKDQFGHLINDLI